MQFTVNFAFSSVSPSHGYSITGKMIMKKAFILGLTLLMAGCSEASLRGMADKEDIALSEQFVRDIQTGNDAAALKAVDAKSQAEMTAALPGYRLKLPKDATAKLTLVGVGTEKSAEYGGESVDQAKLDYEIGGAESSTDLRIKISRYSSGNRIASFEINPKDEE
jgi:hypothetical protein